MVVKGEISDESKNAKGNGSSNEGQNSPLDELPKSEMFPVATDQVFNMHELGSFDRSNLVSLKNRDSVYSKILKCYYKYIHTILKRNPRRQTLFFWISLIILTISPVQFLIFVWTYDTQSWPVLLASSAELVSALIVFPKIIAEYLFNTSETTNINDVVSAIQNYDVAVRGGIRHTVESTESKSEN